MKCGEFEEQISAAVDKRLSPGEADDFRGHATVCPRCQFEYEMEAFTKRIVRKNLPLVPVPAGLQERILRELARARRSGSATMLLRDAWRKPFVAPALALLATAVLVAIMVNREGVPADVTDLASAEFFRPDDVIGQSVRDYHGMLTGAIRPDIMAREPGQLLEFFAGRTEFPVRVISVRGWTPVGGMLNDHRGARVAHIVYESDRQFVSVYQTCWETVQKGTSLELSGKTLQMLRTGERFVGRNAGGDAVVAWTEGNTLCVAVAHMDHRRLVEYLRAAEPSPPR